MPISEQLRALFQRFFPKKRKKRRTETSSSIRQFLENSSAISVVVFVFTVMAIVATSFVGIKVSGLQFLPNQQATIGIVAAEPFSYKSELLTEEKRNRLSSEVQVIYKRNLSEQEKFQEFVGDLLGAMKRYKRIEEDLSAEAAGEAIRKMAGRFSRQGNINISTSDLTNILEYTDAETLDNIIRTGLLSLMESHKLGVWDRNDPQIDLGPNSTGLIEIDGEIELRRAETKEEALTMLQVNLNALNVRAEVAASVIRIFRDGVVPNLSRNDEAMQKRARERLESLEPVIVHVEKGASIIEPNTSVTEEQYEQHMAYIRHMADKNVAIFDSQLAGRVLLVFAMVIAGVFFIRLEDRETLKSNARLGLLSLVIIVNLTLVRACFELGNTEQFIYDSKLSAILPYITPTALAPITVAILMGTGPGVLTALLISVFSAVMFGNRLDLLVMSFLASIVAIHVCRHVRRRGRVVVGGLSAGITIATFTLLFNWVDQLPIDTIIKQMAAGLLTGVIEGIVILGALPILEGLFKRTTDITFLELSDYNHPILRRMQMEAPGTWHHSLMVANLAENACNSINANALLARVCCMFHDIGKLIKPEYFTENQLDGRNPHDEKTPSFSALIIKSHVKEGVDLGLTYKLPRPIIDVIRQHHGTNLIRYFHHKAMKEAEKEGSGNLVQESTYRYDGPKPQFKESAVILLADSLEAASRSLSKVTPQNIEELVDRIFKINMDDGQLDECPITMAEISKIRASFIRTLLNSLHSRIAYPSTQQPQAGTSKKSNERKAERVEANAN